MYRRGCLLSSETWGLGVGSWIASISPKLWRKQKLGLCPLTYQVNESSVLVGLAE